MSTAISMRSASRNAQVFLLALLVALGMTFVSLGAMPQPAQAAGCGTGACISTGVSGSFNGNITGTSFNNSGGGGGSISVNSQPPLEPGAVKMSDADSKKYCPVGHYNYILNKGDGKRYDVNMYGIAYKTSYGGGQYSVACRYPYDALQFIYNEGSRARDWKAANGDESYFFCILSYNGEVNRLANSHLGAKTGLKKFSQTVTTTANIVAGGISNCSGDYDMNVFYNIPPGQPGFGQYEATARAMVVGCRFLEGNTGRDISRTTICGTPTAVTSRATLTAYCNGFDKGLTDWRAKSAACGTTTPGNPGTTGGAETDLSSQAAQCVIDGSSKVDGKGGVVDLLRNGKEHKVTWGTPRITGGATKVSNWRVKTEVVEGSTPYNKDLDRNHAKQYFDHKLVIPSQSNGLLGPTGGSTTGFYKIPGAALTQSQSNVGHDLLKFYKSSDRDKEFQLKRTYMFDAEMTVKTTSISKVDFATGDITTTTTNTTAKVTNNQCEGDLSPKMNVLKTMNDNIRG